MALRGLDIWVLSTRFWKSNIGWPKHPPTEKVLKLNMIFHDSTQKILFSKHRNKAEFKNLCDSEVLSSDFPGLKTLQPHWPHRPLQFCWPHQSLQPYFTKNLPGPDDWMIFGTKMINTVPFLWIINNTIFHWYVSDTLSVGGCWGQLMLLFKKLVDETQMSKPLEVARYHNSIKLLVILPLNH